MHKKSKAKKEKKKCFNFFFMGKCQQQICYDDHQPFQGEKELQKFYNEYKQNIFQNLHLEKNTNNLLQRFIVQKIKEENLPLVKITQQDQNLNNLYLQKLKQHDSFQQYHLKRIENIIKLYTNQKTN